MRRRATMTRIALVASLFLILLALSAPRGVLAGPAPPELPRLATGFENTGRARVSVGGDVFTLALPRVETAGLAFDHVVAPPRSAILQDATGGPPVPISPIAWERIERIDVEYSHRTRNVVIGAFGGAVLTGLGLLGLMMSVPDGAPSSRQVMGVMVIGGAAGGLLGAALTTPGWRPVYPEPAR